MQFLPQPHISVHRSLPRRGFLHIFFLFIGLIVLITNASTALAVSPKFSLQPQQAYHSLSCSDCMTFHNGYVQTTPRVYLVFWGPKWIKTDPAYDPDTVPVVNEVTNLFNELTDGDLNNILHQYGVQNTVLFNPATSIWFDPSVPPTINGSNASDEAAAALQTNNWINDSNNTNTQVILFPQAETSYNPLYFDTTKICGQHDAGLDVVNHPLPFAVVAYNTDVNCPFSKAPTAAQANADDMTKAAFHEYAETVTDPGTNIIDLGTGWFYNSSVTGEIGDRCNDNTFYYQPSPPYGGPITLPSVFVQQLWSNMDDYCVSQVGQDYSSPVSPGMHTVEGAIWIHYTANNNAIKNIIGEPTSEELTIGSGYVSYFASNACGSYSGPYSSESAIYDTPVTHAWEVGGCIYQHYLTPGGDLSGSQGGPLSKLGFPVSDVNSITGGYVSYFAGNKCGTGGPSNSGSAIYYHNSIGTFVTGCIYNRYMGYSGPQGPYGFPVSDEFYYSPKNIFASYFAGNKCGNSSHPYESGTAIYNDTYGTLIESGCIYDAYIGYGEYTGSLGVPKTDTLQVTGGWLSQFDGTSCGSGSWQGSGNALYTSSQGTFSVKGCIYQEYTQAMQDYAGALKFPLSNEETITGYNGVNGYVNYFLGGNCGNPGPHGSNSAIYDTPATHAHEVQGCIYASYLKFGGPASRLGFPISDEYTGSTGYRESDFTGGTILWTGSGASIILN